MAHAVVLANKRLPTMSSLLEAFLGSPYAADHEVLDIGDPAALDHAALKAACSSDGPLVCAGSLAAVAHLLGQSQRRFFDATEDSHLFRTLVATEYPDDRFYRSDTPWTLALDWSEGRKYVVKPNIGYSSVNTYVVGCEEELRKLADAAPTRDYVVEQFITGEFLCADVATEDGTVVITSVYQRHDYGIKETASFCAASAYRQHAAAFTALVKDVILAKLPVPQCRTLMNIEAKLGADGVLRIVEINPFRACGVAPLLSSLVFGRNVFELAFADVLAPMAPELDKEVLVCYARAEGETAAGLAGPILKKMGGGRRAVEVRRLFHKEDFEWSAIHDGRLFDVVRDELL